jgi:hypothetical protein
MKRKNIETLFSVILVDYEVILVNLITLMMHYINITLLCTSMQCARSFLICPIVLPARTIIVCIFIYIIINYTIVINLFGNYQFVNLFTNHFVFGLFIYLLFFVHHRSLSSCYVFFYNFDNYHYTVY